MNCYLAKILNTDESNEMLMSDKMTKQAIQSNLLAHPGKRKKDKLNKQ
jgi:hypothetical protein